MAEDNVADDIELLRRVLTALEQRLEALEQWRALRQLDERERNGNPLEGFDGVLFRGRLVQGLALSSRDWRAYVRVEEAIGHLQGAPRLEQGILKGPSSFEAVAAAAAKGGRSAMPPKAPVADGAEAPDQAPDQAQAQASDAQRLRVKVRAGSLPVSPTPIEAILNPVRPLGNSRAGIPAVAELSPRPSISPENIAEDERGQARAPGHAAADLRSPRSVLQRIRLVSKSAGPSGRATLAAGPSEADAAQDLLGAPLPPILQEGPKPAPPATGSLGIADRTASVVNAAPRSLQRNEAGFEPPAAAVAGSIVAERQQRLDALETELGQLIDRSATWPHPLDARRPVSLAHQPAPTLEPDTAVELDVDEAEVTIVRLAEPEATIREYPIRPPPRVKPPKPEPEPDERPNGEDYAGYRLELEEASVEIIVPDAAGGGEGAPPSKNRAE